jgi:hypothetical protein
MFRKVSKDRLRERIDNVDKSTRPYYIKREFDVYRPKEGDNFIRILPPVGDMDDFSLDIWVHSYIGPDKGSYLCREKVLGKRCAICEIYKKWKMQGKDEQAAQIATRRRTLFWILDISDKPQSDKPLIFDAPYKQVAREILMRCLDKRTKEVIDISDLKTGREISFTLHVKGNKMLSEYTGVSIGMEYPISPDLAQYVVPLKDVLVIPKKEEMEELASIVVEFVGSEVVEEEEGNELSESVTTKINKLF